LNLLQWENLSMERKYVRALNLHYRFSPDEQTLTFDDGVVYTLDEAMLLAKGKANDEDIAAVHLVKKAFGATLEDGFTEAERLFRVQPEVRQVPEARPVPAVRKVDRERKKAPTNPDQMSLII
jgi:hypothetical protein